MSRRPCLKSITSAAPCSTRWSDLPGTDRLRHCGACRNRVYRFDELASPESDELLTWTEGRPIQHVFARVDGTFMTRNCAVGQGAQLQRQHWQTQRRWAAMAMTMIGVLGLAASAPDAAPPSHEATPIAGRSAGALSLLGRPYSPPHRHR